jgi:hypothetical protein
MTSQETQVPIFINFTKTLTLGALAFGLAAGAHAADYTAQSPANRVALVELYSSEGCSSCPPADQWLSKLGAQAKADRVVPLALHVDYWDNLGWKDRFGDRRFTARQQELAGYAKTSLVYTPEVFAGGRELRRWSSGSAFDSTIDKIVAQPSPADIAIKLSGTTPRSFDLATSFKLRQDSKDGHDAYVAVYENKLVSNVAAANLRADRFGIVAFVQNTNSGEVLQVARLAVDH